MSVLARFEYGKHKMKALIFERCSKRLPCSVCEKPRAQGMLVRHVMPTKKDTGICNECLVILSLGMSLKLNENGDLFGKFNPKAIVINSQRRRGYRKKKKVLNGKEKATETVSSGSESGPSPESAIESGDTAKVVKKTKRANKSD